MNNLPKVVAQQRRGWASNPRLLDRKSDALPLGHRATQVVIQLEGNKINKSENIIIHKHKAKPIDTKQDVLSPPVHQNAPTFESVCAFHHILLPLKFHDNISNG